MTKPQTGRSEALVTSQESSQVRDNILIYLRERPGATVQEVGEAVGLRSSSSAFYQLAVLEEKGQIKRENCSKCDGKVWIVREEVVA